MLSPGSPGTASRLLLQGCCQGKRAVTELEHPTNLLGAGLSPTMALQSPSCSLCPPSQNHAGGTARERGQPRCFGRSAATEGSQWLLGMGQHFAMDRNALRATETFCIRKTFVPSPVKTDITDPLLSEHPHAELGPQLGLHFSFTQCIKQGPNHCWLSKKHLEESESPACQRRIPPHSPCTCTGTNRMSWCGKIPLVLLQTWLTALTVANCPAEVYPRYTSGSPQAIIELILPRCSLHPIPAGKRRKSHKPPIC